MNSYYKKSLIILFKILYCLMNSLENWHPVGTRIKTKWGNNLKPENVWKEYPRPQL